MIHDFEIPRSGGRPEFIQVMLPAPLPNGRAYIWRRPRKVGGTWVVTINCQDRPLTSSQKAEFGRQFTVATTALHDFGLWSPPQEKRA